MQIIWNGLNYPGEVSLKAGTETFQPIANL